MNAKTALINTLKYNSLAMIPSFIGLSMILISLYLLIGQPVLEVLDVLEQQDLQWILENDQEVLNLVLESSSYLLSPILIVIGYLVHRIGRTFLLFYFHGKATVNQLENNSDATEKE